MTPYIAIRAAAAVARATVFVIDADVRVGGGVNTSSRHLAPKVAFDRPLCHADEDGCCGTHRYSYPKQLFVVIRDEPVSQLPSTSPVEDTERKDDEK